MDSKLFGQFIAKTRKEKNMTQAELAGIINVSDKTISRWERGVGFPDIKPLAKALDITVFELIHSEKSNMQKENISEGQVIEIMYKAVEMSKENQRQEQVSLRLGAIVTVIIAILIKIFSKSSVCGALFMGGLAAVAVVSLYYYVRNVDNNQSRKIYGSFMLIGTFLTTLIMQLAGMVPEKIVWLVYSMFFLSVILTYKKTP